MAHYTQNVVNFIGVEDEFVTSGSDDGNFFLWEKATGRLHGIYEGDGSVVNVIENHPRLPLIACSGIDTTIKVNYHSFPGTLLIRICSYSSLPQQGNSPNSPKQRQRIGYRK